MSESLYDAPTAVVAMVYSVLSLKTACLLTFYGWRNTCSRDSQLTVSAQLCRVLPHTANPLSQKCAIFLVLQKCPSVSLRSRELEDISWVLFRHTLPCWCGWHCHFVEPGVCSVRCGLVEGWEHGLCLILPSNQPINDIIVIVGDHRGHLWKALVGIS